MQVLSAQTLLLAWEQAQCRRPAERAVAFIAACTDAGITEIAVLPLGALNAMLLDVHTRLYGAQIEAAAGCPACDSRLEFSLDSGELRPDVYTPRENRLDLREGGYELSFRGPSAGDLLAAASCSTIDEARAVMLQRCLITATRAGAAVEASALPDFLVEKLEQAIEEMDPLAETLLDLTCPACENRWQAALDLGSFVWAEVSASARRLLADVHRLASAYGWREGEVLALSKSRRRLYLELVG
jgi:hypothetical protein